MLRGFWKGLVMRKVKTVKTLSKPFSVYRYEMDDLGNIDIDHSFRGEKIPSISGVKDNEFYKECYSKYFGFTFKFGEGDREIYFSSENYNGMDFDIDCSAWFSHWGNHGGGYEPPQRGQFICGIVKEGPKGPYYDKWFICSDQFFNFWRFVMGENHKQDIHDILEKVDTLRWTAQKLSTSQRKTKLEEAYRWSGCFDYNNDTDYGSLVKYMALNEKPHMGSKPGKIIRNICDL